MSYTPLDEDSSKEMKLDEAYTETVATSRTNLLRTSPKSASLVEPLTKTTTASADSNDDPFYVFRADLSRKLETLDEYLAEYLRIVHQTDTAVNTLELKDAKKALKRGIKNAEATLKDVQMAVQVVENDRERFLIDDDELYERKTLVQTSRDRIARTKSEISSQAVSAKLLADERAKALRRNNNNLGARTAAEQENTDMIMDSQARTSLLMQHQDETLDDLDAAVVRVGAMAESIHEEIGQQNKMLDEMEEDLADAEEQLGMVMGKLAKFLKTKDKWQLGTIVTLFFIMMVLLMLVLYT